MKHMLISRTGTRTGVIDEWLSARGLERRIALIVPHFLSAPFIVAKTDMLLSLPDRIARQFLALAPLSILPAPIELPVYELVMVWHPLRENDPAHRWLRQQISGGMSRRWTSPRTFKSPSGKASSQGFDLKEKVGRL